MTITYTISIDRDDDSPLTLELSDTIDSDVLHLAWRLGTDEPYQAVLPPAEARITVRNRDGAYSPQQTMLLPGSRVQIFSDDGVTERVHFTGILASVEPETGTQGSQRAVLIARGLMHPLTQDVLTLVTRRNVRAGDIIDIILDKTRWRYAALEGFCVIDWDGRNLIDSTTIFPPQGEAIERDVQPGRSVLAFVGDIWRDDMPAATALRHLAEAEGGRFFFTRDGTATFYQRNNTLTNATLRATFSDDMDAAMYDYGAAHINRADVQLIPRSTGALNTLLWSLAAPLFVGKGETVRLSAPYRDPTTGAPLGALYVIPPQPYTHYLANYAATGDLIDFTANADVRLVEEGGAASTLEIRNISDEGLWVTFLELRGTPLYTGDPYIIAEEDSLSITRYGLRRETFDLPLIADADDARSIAQTQLTIRRQLSGRIRRLTTSTHTRPIVALAVTLLERVRVQESQTAHDGDYLVIGEAHEVDKGGSRHRVTWYLEPSGVGEYVIINRSTIDDSSKVLLPR